MKACEHMIQLILFICAIIAVLGVILISYFIINEGYPVIRKVGIWEFISGQKWAPTKEIYGIYPMIAGSLLVTIGALVLGVPIGIGCAIFMAELARPRIVEILKPGIELLAGIPSVIYGLYGLTVIVPFIRKVFNNQGFSVLAGSIVLAVMILPTIINVSESAIRSVPKEYKEASLSLGSSHWQSIKNVIVPAAHSGITAAVILGMGRAIGETMAVIMIAGNSPLVPESLLSPVRTLTGNIGIEMGYASGEHQQALFATGIVLFVFVMLLNIAANLIPKKAGE
ncbi:MAG TPA: phosphate ABC transporter permease subunit PstC [Bacillota bacterium]|jgi:phosphate transport system permease protein|nr:phosphate ABC transporter permease subunit PstC [Bacillota bacterium]HQE66958.1 phosphate ABC transporter permease subunit PstC [Bacillota bacterium]HQJ37868.1 phosphate ABC transporter permease subunit PstC [Bacillota bacterium]HQL35444.1 phosphate ABC transporter permease subunit PstC [Bacillota bacterium]HRU41393.1 phosphate ABC transporter permease subunit PstC [Candidatus Diapherotrites archaeon]